MKLLLIQTDIKWEDAPANRDHICHLVDNEGPADLIVLPEMFTTGFCTAPAEVAEERGIETLAWMRELAKRKNAAVAGSVSVRENGQYYNRFFFVKPDGACQAYDKRHLFSYGGEDREYTSGDKRVVVEYNGFRILLQVCYDLRFPVFSRNRGDYDMILYVASWPAARARIWSTLLQARAIENQCYVAGVNRVGDDPYNSYSGGTVMLGFTGECLAKATDGKEEAVAVVVGDRPLNDFRKGFPALDDADEFKIIDIK